MNRESLNHFFEGRASEKEMWEIKFWMESSPDNEQIFLKEHKIFDATLLLGKKREKESLDNLKVASRRYIRETLRIVAVILLTLGINYLYESYHAQIQEVSFQIITVPSGQRVNLTLPDGTAVWLNARTTLAYPVDFKKKERLLQLDGEAYFEVAPDTRRPFIVETSRGRVEALGTNFNVEAYSFSNVFEATLMSGKIKVSLNDKDTESIILSPGKKTYLKDGILQIDHVTDFTPYRWREGLICFKRASFTSIMKEFEKYYGVEILVRNEKVLQYYYTGKFRHTDGIDYALRVLQENIFFEYGKDDELQVIYID
jgi:ferric-dicitrate binding protein FerR (iron transport regulator)